MLLKSGETNLVSLQMFQSFSEVITALFGGRKDEPAPPTADAKVSTKEEAIAAATRMFGSGAVMSKAVLDGLRQ